MLVTFTIGALITLGTPTEIVLRGRILPESGWSLRPQTMSANLPEPGLIRWGDLMVGAERVALPVMDPCEFPCATGESPKPFRLDASHLPRIKPEVEVTLKAHYNGRVPHGYDPGFVYYVALSFQGEGRDERSARRAP